MKKTPMSKWSPEDFLEYLKEHQDIKIFFWKFTFDLIKTGRVRFSARTIIERMRWEYIIKSTAGEEFKLNDHIVPWMSRLFTIENPEHEKFFERRKSNSDALFEYLNSDERR